MSVRAILIGLAVALPILALGAFLWSRQGIVVWLQGAIAYCF